MTVSRKQIKEDLNFWLRESRKRILHGGLRSPEAQYAQGWIDALDGLLKREPVMDDNTGD